jgi:hypothetical protein
VSQLFLAKDIHFPVNFPLPPSSLLPFIFNFPLSIFNYPRPPLLGLHPTPLIVLPLLTLTGVREIAALSSGSLLDYPPPAGRRPAVMKILPSRQHSFSTFNSPFSIFINSPLCITPSPKPPKSTRLPRKHKQQRATLTKILSPAKNREKKFF